MIDERLLDDADELARVDTRGALLALASAGARVRTGLRLAEEAGLAGLRPEGRPRAVLVAGHGAAALAGDVLAGLGGSACPVLVLRPGPAEPDPAMMYPVTRSDDFTLGLDWALPGWVGPSDLLVVAASVGSVPGLITLVERAYQRGCSIVSIAPAGSRLAEAAVQARGMPLPYTPGLAAALDGYGDGPDDDLPREDPSDFWGLLAPLLALAQRTGVVPIASDALQAAANRLDEVAVRCRPAAETYGNPAKALAARLATALPLLWSDGDCAAAAARRFAAMLADHAARPALTGALPEALTTQRGLFTGTLGAGGGPDDFFRDRVEDESALRLEVLLLRRTPRAGNGSADSASAPEAEGSWDVTEDPFADHLPDSGSPAAGHTVARAHRLAADHQVGLRELTSTRADPIEALAELIALTDFAAVYLGLAAETEGN
ncbi:SIS domain-containing protein [Streptacidiphilus fuscans]|uniref:Mannose-6-phosphate isomerase n=1 Tax=Streptacidiphilus fuscans TaxID=2789292 RepID=A0A931B8T2_9ACTN|nr:SIS domain-containing protein [Streptacidiphilus fuscans]MBF9073330.1 mannose-6-phosphate isomerase [Streptacidiphilus fuscans]